MFTATVTLTGSPTQAVFATRFDAERFFRKHCPTQTVTVYHVAGRVSQGPGVADRIIPGGVAFVKEADRSTESERQERNLRNDLIEQGVKRVGPSKLTMRDVVFLLQPLAERNRFIYRTGSRRFLVVHGNARRAGDRPRKIVPMGKTSPMDPRTIRTHFAPEFAYDGSARPPIYPNRHCP